MQRFYHRFVSLQRRRTTGFQDRGRNDVQLYKKARSLLRARLLAAAFLTPVGAIVVGCAVAVALGFGVDAAKDAWLERRR